MIAVISVRFSLLCCCFSSALRFRNVLGCGFRLGLVSSALRFRISGVRLELECYSILWQPFSFLQHRCGLSSHENAPQGHYTELALSRPAFFHGLP